jgi:hypothetical protein
VAQGYVVVPTADGHVDFDLQTAWTPEILRAFVDSGADGLIANYARGFIDHDLEFIRSLHLRRLDVLARTITDLSPVYDLAQTLEQLRVQAGTRTRIDLAELPNLRGLSCSWSQVADTIHEAAAIDDLYLGSYDPIDLTPLAHLTSLRSLRMKDRPAIRSLDGVESLPWLAHLGIYLAPLEDTGALARLASPVLTELRFGSCKRLGSLSNLRGLIGLRLLEVSNAGAIESLGPIAGAQQLAVLYLYESTNIADGDLSSLLGLRQLRDLRMMNRRHYAPSVQEVKARLGLAP